VGAREGLGEGIRLTGDGSTRNDTNPTLDAAERAFVAAWSGTATAYAAARLRDGSFCNLQG